MKYPHIYAKVSIVEDGYVRYGARKRISWNGPTMIFVAGSLGAYRRSLWPIGDYEIFSPVRNNESSVAILKHDYERLCKKAAAEPRVATEATAHRDTSEAVR